MDTEEETKGLRGIKHTKCGHDSSKNNNADWLNTKLANWVFVNILTLHGPPCKQKDDPCYQVQQRLQC